jgi:hypothetical protein
MSRVPCFLVAAVFVSITVQLRAEVVLPTGLAPGSQYEIAFVTADTTTATSSDINYYNNFVTREVNQDAALASLGVSWHAIASTASVNANKNAPFNSQIPVYNTLGALVANAASPLYVPVLLNSMRGDQFGNSGLKYVWTGSNYDGNALHPLGGNYGAMDTLGFTSLNGWYNDGGATANNYIVFSLYGLSNPITVVPEPSALILLGIGAISLLAYAWRRHTKAS